MNFFPAVVAITLLALLHPSAPAWAQANLCMETSRPVAVAACTKDIQSGRFTGKDLAVRYLNRGRAQARQKQFQKAIADFSEAMKLDPKNVLPYLRRREMYLELGDIDLAIADVTSVIALEPNDADYLAMRGDLYQQKGDHQSAIRDYTANIALDPKGVGWSARCWSRAVANIDLRPAIADCDKAIELNQTFGSIWDSRAFVFFRLERYREAIEDYTEQLKRRPNFAHSLYGRGLAKLKLGDQAGGEADIAAARKIYGEIAAVYRKYGVDR